MSDLKDGILPRLQDDPAIYEQIFSSSSDSMSLVGRDFRYKRVNDSYIRRMGRPRDQIEGRHVAELMGRDVFERDIRPQFERCLDGQSVSYSRWFDYQGVGSRFMEVTYAPCRDSRGEIIGIVVNARDCTEQRREEERREKAESHFREMFSSAPMAAVIADGAGTILDCNDLMASMTGYSRDELIGMRYNAFTHPEDIDKELGLARRKWNGGASRFSLEKRYITKSGGTVWARTHVSNIYDARGELECNFAFIEDVTEKRQLLQAMQESRKFLHAALRNITYHLENSPLCVIELNGDLRVNKWNARAEDIFGWKAFEVAGKSPRDFNLIHAGDAPKFETMFERISKGVDPHNTLDLRNQAKDGRVIRCKWFNSAFKDETGLLVSMLCAIEVLDTDTNAPRRERAQAPDHSRAG